MSKTPISILQELMIQRKANLPQYELLPSEGFGTHLPTFHFRVTVENIVAEGKARSKKEAKHAAAKNALEQLCASGVYQPPDESTPPASSPSVSTPNQSSPDHAQVNTIGVLQELCYKNNISPPEYQLKTAIGPAHQIQFTYECKVASITTTATEFTKKKAKQLAAQQMLNRLMDTLAEVITKPKDTETSVEPASLSLEHKKTNSLRTIMRRKKLTKECLWQDINNRDEADLQGLLNKLDLKYRIEYIDNEDQTLVSISINTEPEIEICEISEIKEEALYGAIYKCFVILEIMTNW